MIPENSLVGVRPVDSWCFSARGTVWSGQLLEPELVVPTGNTHSRLLSDNAALRRGVLWRPIHGYSASHLCRTRRPQGHRGRLRLLAGPAPASAASGQDL